MRESVAERAHPWIDGWEKLCEDPLASADFKPSPLPNLGTSRQRASRDAHAAYLNAIRWYISGDDRYADSAIRICNAWANTTNQVPSGQDVPGLSGIPIAEFALVGEVLRICPRWTAKDQERFKQMFRTYWYPAVHDFLSTQNAPGNTHYWANWNICNIGACIAIGVLLDDHAIFDEGVNYYRSEVGTGAIRNAVYFIHDGGLGQWQESGRDQPHAQLGVGMVAQLCEVAWKQGVDLYGEDDNRLLKGAEYVAQWDMWRPVPFRAYDNSDHANQRWPSINGRGRLNRPIWELLYNHYVVRKGIIAPNTTAFANLTRVEGGSIDHFGYGTLTFTLDAAKSPFPPSPSPPSPSKLVAEAGVGRVFLRWQGSGETAQGYEVRRATVADGPFTTIASWTDNTRCEHIDADVLPGTRYIYAVAGRNQSGVSEPCHAVAATPADVGALPEGWTASAIGKTPHATTTPANSSFASFASVGGGTFVVQASGGGVAPKDSIYFVSHSVEGDVTLTARLSDIRWARGGKSQKVGLMMRASLAPDAPMFLIKLGDVGARQAGAGVRQTPGSNVNWTGGNDYTWIPAWFRLQRTGSTLIAFESSDGQEWFEVTRTDISALRSDTSRIGLFVSSGSNQETTRVQFDSVSISR